MSLVGYWPLDEQSSGDAIDYAGNNDGTVNGATQGATGVLGETAYHFDGSNDYVDITGSQLSSFPISVSLWVYHTGGGYLYTQSTDTSSDNIIGVSLGTTAKTYLRGQTSNFVYAESDTLSEGSWYHICSIWESGELHIYIDGEHQDTVSHSDQFPVLDNSHIGRLVYTNDIGYTDGRICEVRLYDHALTPSEVQYLYDVSKEGLQTSGKKTL